MTTDDDDKSLIINNLRSILRDETALAKDKIAAARALGEVRGLLGKNAEAAIDTRSKDLSLMTAAELDAEIKRLSARK